MALKLKLTKAEYDALDEALQALYAEAGDDGYELEVEGGSIKEFRANNIKLQKAKKDLERKVTKLTEDLEKFKDVDPEKYRETLEAIEKLKKKAGKGDDDNVDVDEVVNAAVERALGPVRETLKKVSENLKTSQKREREADQRARNERLSSRLTGAATKGGVRASAIPDVLSRARSAGWKVNDDGDVIQEENGAVVVDDTGNNLSVEGWLSGLRREGGEHLFEETRGGGTPPGRPNRGGGGGGGGDVTTVENPSQDWLSANLGDVASGKIRVVRSGAGASE